MLPIDTADMAGLKIAHGGKKVSLDVHREHLSTAPMRGGTGQALETMRSEGVIDHY